MSGIIGGVGSRSGVIGVTELNYEEGTYNIIERQGGISGSSVGHYTLLNKTCTVQGYWTPSSNQPSETSVPHIALPFTSAATPHYSIGPVAHDGWNLTGLYSVFLVYPGNNYMRWFQIADDAGWIAANDSNIALNENLVFSMTYKIA